MKIDWKYVATTKGYKSLKAAYVHDVQDAEQTRSKGRRPMRDKATFLIKFKWVIARATYHAEHEKVTIDVILDRWESKRTYWWLNYYGDYKNQGKYSNNKLKPRGAKGIKASLKEDTFHRNDPIRLQYLVNKHIQIRQREASTKSPKRWSNERKADAKEYSRIYQSL